MPKSCCLTLFSRASRYECTGVCHLVFRSHTTSKREHQSYTWRRWPDWLAVYIPGSLCLPCTGYLIVMDSGEWPDGPPIAAGFLVLKVKVILRWIVLLCQAELVRRQVVFCSQLPDVMDRVVLTLVFPVIAVHCLVNPAACGCGPALRSVTYMPAGFFSQFAEITSKFVHAS